MRRYQKHSGRSRVWLPIGIVLVVLAGIMIYNSGILMDFGLMKSPVPEGLGIDPDDPRVQALVDADIDRAEAHGFVNRFVDLIVGRPERGSVKVKAVDGNQGFPLAGFTFELKDAITEELLEVLTTDASGEALSAPVAYRRAYSIEAKLAPAPYRFSEEKILFEMKAPVVEVTVKEQISEGVKAYRAGENGGVVIESFEIPMDVLLQKPELPNGCEITALAALLIQRGYSVNKVGLSDIYLPKQAFFRKGGKLYGADPNQAFSGDPKDPTGWFVYAPPTVMAGNAYLNDQSSPVRAVDITGASRDAIMEHILAGTPVAMWVTRELDLGKFEYGWHLIDSGEWFDAPINLHCMVVHGFDGDMLHVMDPLKGDMMYSAELFFKSYESLGAQAIVLEEAGSEH